MKTVTRILSLAVVGCGLAAALPAHADTAYHRVYHTSIAADDPFSVLDKYQNNVLTADEYNNGAMGVPLSVVDANHDGFVTRQEFYAYYRAPVPENATDLNLIMPAAGGYVDEDADNQCSARY
jgi:hypothetical protein